jgi:hypothetical protein
MHLEQTALPFAQKGSLHSRHASYTGAVAAKKSRGVKTRLYMQWLRMHGPATDHDAVDATGISLNAINSIRNTLMAAGLVTSAGITGGMSGARRTLWRAQEV